jgi:Tol biopolymer transport system component
VAFSSASATLVAGDTNNQSDLFLHDRQTKQTVRISLGPGAVQANGASAFPSLSADGRFVAFQSTATNLAVGDNNNVSDIYLWDRTTGKTLCASCAGNGNSQTPSLSDDGRRVAFTSLAGNLTPGDSNGVSDIFLYDFSNATLRRISVSSGGTQANGPSEAPDLSPDGRFIAFSSAASNLVAGDVNGYPDIFLHDLGRSALIRVSVSTFKAEGNDGSSMPAVASGGRVVAFASVADNLTSGDRNFSKDIFANVIEYE